MAYFLLKNAHLCGGKSVLELGAGMTGLAGFALAAQGTPKAVTVTDGNRKSVENLKAILKANRFRSGLF